MTDNRRVVRIQDLIGRPVLALNGKTIGRLEEIHVEASGPNYDVTHYYVGAGALRDRFGVHAFPGAHELIVRWDQLEFDDDNAMRLTCSVDELESRRGFDTLRSR
jgi:sporulation protein YlmC with PRC-barrel domain